MSATHVDSWYAASAKVFAGLPSLRGDEQCDVCVIGGGITGLSAALELAERGYSVIVLEGRQIGWGASGRSGGQVIPGYACDMQTLARGGALADAKRLWAMSLEAVHLLRERIQRYAIDCDWRPGQLHVAIKPRQVAELRRHQHELEETYGYGALAWLDREALAAHIRSPRYLAGIYDPTGGHVHPLNYTVGLAHAARAKGVRIFEHSLAERLTRGAQPVVHLAQGQVRARQVVLAGNAWLGPLVPELDARIMPVGTYIIASGVLGAARARELMPSDAAITDINFVLDYFRLSADHRMLFGGRVSYSGITPPNLAASMRRRMVQVFPSLADVGVDYAWGGYVDITMNRAPHFGRMGQNLYFAQGFSGHGMAITGLAGRVIAEAIAGDSERLDVFARIPHRVFPGGRWLRTPSLMLAMMYYRLRDFL